MIDYQTLYAAVCEALTDDKQPAGEREKIKIQQADLERRFPQLAKKEQADAVQK
jgi:hypothetical protein